MITYLYKFQVLVGTATKMLSQDVKANAVGRKQVKTRSEMMENVRRHLCRRQRQPDVVRCLLHEKYVAYACPVERSLFVVLLSNRSRLSQASNVGN